MLQVWWLPESKKADYDALIELKKKQLNITLSTSIVKLLKNIDNN